MIDQMQPIRVALLSLYLLTSLPAAQAATCFWPDSSSADPIYVPCNVNPADTGNRTCCAEEDVCLSNKACFSLDVGVIYRGACTDGTFQNSNCLQVFTRVNPSGTANMFSCGNGSFRSGSTRCDDSDVFRYTEAEIIGLQKIQTSSSSAGSSSSSSSTSASPSTPTSPNGPALPAVEVSTCSGDVATARKTVGLGLGLGLGLPLLAALAALALLWRSGRRPVAAEAQPPSHAVPEKTFDQVSSSTGGVRMSSRPSGFSAEQMPGELDGGQTPNRYEGSGQQ